MLGNKQFELSNLPIAIGIGNVLTTVSDRKIPHTSDNITIDYYTSDITSAQDYYAFGQLMPGRNVSSNEYKFGFNGKEKDDEVSGTGNQYDYGFRIYNPRIAKFLSVDPLTKSYPWWSPYAFAGNTPIQAIDLDGLEIYYAQSGQKIGIYGTSTEVRVVNEDQLAKANAEFKTYNEALKTNSAATNEFLGGSLNSSGSVAYKDYFTTKADVTNDAKLIEWSNPASYGNTPGNKNCYDAAEKQLNNAGEKLSGDAIQTKTANGSGLIENAIGGSIYIMTQLKKDKAVMIGLEVTMSDNTIYNAKNTNSLTGHFMVINSSTVDENGNVSFGYLDNATYKGKNKNNQLSLDLTNGSMKDDTPAPAPAVKSYKVSEVRKNK